MRRSVKHAMLAAAVMAIASAAEAHAVLEVREAAVGAPYKAVIKITHGCEGSPTLKVRVEVPEGVIGVKPMPKAGWTLATVKGPYARSYKFYHGSELTSGVKEITWTGRLEDEHYDEFVFAGFLDGSLAAPGTLYFPTHQECEKGAHHWIETPGPGQDAHALKSPAPGLKLLQVADKAVQSYKVGDLVIEAPWARATPGGAQVAGGYLKITNKGQAADRLVGGSLAVAGSVEVHEMAMDNNVMKMRQLQQGLEIKPGQTVELKPGGYHMMFMGLREGLKEGQTIKGTLVFEKAGTVAVEYRVAPIGAQSGSMHTHH